MVYPTKLLYKGTIKLVKKLFKSLSYLELSSLMGHYTHDKVNIEHKVSLFFSGATTFSIKTLSIIIACVIMLIIIIADSDYAECRIFYCDATCRYTECRYADCRGTLF
jgi:hypothetical protein